MIFNPRMNVLIIIVGCTLVALLTVLFRPTPLAQALSDPVSMPASAGLSFVTGEVLIKVKPGFQLSTQARVALAGFAVADRSMNTTAQSLDQLLATVQPRQAELLSPGSATYRVIVPPEADVVQVAQAIAAHPAVEFAEPNALRQIMRTPNDPFVREQWALTNIQAFEAWDITTGAEIVVAVIDTGVSSSHPDLTGKVLPGYDAITGSDRSEDVNGHGTAVSGLIAANTNNGKGIAGLCWGCRILPIKALSSQGVGDDASIARGIRHATDAGARIINLSLGGTQDTRVLREAVEYAYDRGVLVVAASGNERQQGNAVNYPAAYPQVLAVSGTSNADTITGFSNTGSHIDIAAPSVGLWTTLVGEREYGPPNGTSFASPYVAGAAALVWTVRPDLSHVDVKCVLSASADDKGPPGWDEEYGWGRLNVFRAVQLAQTYNGCPLQEPTPITEQPPATQPPPAQPSNPFAPIEPIPSTPDQMYFPETQHSIRGGFKAYWERHGGLPIFGYPISEEFVERAPDGRDYVVQYFERYRFELHPENAAPYNVQLGRLGDVTLELQGRSWWDFTRSAPTPGCQFFEATGHTLCEPFLGYWQRNGLEFDGLPGKSFAESMALFGQPISGSMVEEVEPGVYVTVQWFERARFEDHGSNGVLLGLLSRDLTQARGWR